MTFLVRRPTCILVGLGVSERSFRRRLEDAERDLRLRPSLTAPLSGEDALACLFSLSLSRSKLRRSVRSFDFGRGALTSFGASFAGLALRERVAVLRLVRERSAPLLEDDEELDDDELLLEELDREPELLRDELLSDELLSLLLEFRFLRSFSRPRCFFSTLSESADSERFFERAILYQLTVDQTPKIALFT